MFEHITYCSLVSNAIYDQIYLHVVFITSHI